LGDPVRQVAAGKVTVRDAKRTVAWHGYLERPGRHVEKIARETDVQSSRRHHRAQRELFSW
jgi:hypothetical protein